MQGNFLMVLLMPSTRSASKVGTMNRKENFTEYFEKRTKIIMNYIYF